MTWSIVDPAGHQRPVSTAGLKIGRAPDNDIVLADEQASRQHAFVQTQQNELWLHDLNSFNGVYVNGVRLHGAHRLQPGDDLLMGRSHLGVEYTRPIDMFPEPAAVVGPSQPAAGGAASMWAPILLGAGLGIVALLVAVWVFLRPTTPPVAPPTAPAPGYGIYADGVRALALLLTPVGDTATSIAGNGIVLNDKGRLLTAYSVVYDPQTGRAHNAKSQVLVGFRSDGRYTGQSLDRWYLARVVRADRTLDLAVLQIFAQGDGSPLPNSFEMRPAAMGSGAAMQVGERMAALSFAGLGSAQGQENAGRNLQIGEGPLRAFLADASLTMEKGWLATDIGLTTGQLGAPVFDGRGRLVGLFTGAPTSSGSLIRPIELASPLLVGALSESQ